MDTEGETGTSITMSTGRHLFIAGTGRAGTSFLVRYLNELGLDTHLSRAGGNAYWDNDANAGLEEMPLPQSADVLPYVVKSPWLYQIVDEVLATEAIGIDAVIIPVRDLAEAAISRCIVERRAVHRTLPWMTDVEAPWEEFAHTPGGMVFSMNPIDQGRLLAVGFHHLVQRLVARDIPIVFVDFPRIVHDGDYLFEKLRFLLPSTVTWSRAVRAHATVADRSKDRVGDERRKETGEPLRTAPILHYDTTETLDTIAVRRELKSTREHLAKARQDLASSTQQAEAREASLRAALEAAQGTLVVSESALDQARSQLDATRSDLQRLSRSAADTREQLAVAEAARRQDAARHAAELTRLREQAIILQRSLREQDARIASLTSSRSWRMTRPYRAVGEALRRSLARFARKH